MMLWAALLSMFLIQATASTPQAFVTEFYTVYIREHSSGLFLQGRARRAVYPLLSARLRTLLDDAAACQKDWQRQQPKGSTDKPPFVECCLFSSMPDGMATSFALGPTKVLAGSRYEVAVAFVRKETRDLIKWRDAVIVIKERGRFVVDDVVYDVETGPPEGRLSDSFDGCRGRRWVGGD
jgi:hypothetical protein